MLVSGAAGRMPAVRAKNRFEHAPGRFADGWSCSPALLSRLDQTPPNSFARAEDGSPARDPYMRAGQPGFNGRLLTKDDGKLTTNCLILRLSRGVAGRRSARC